MGSVKQQEKVLERLFRKINNVEDEKMWERFKFWMMGYKDCAGCCLGCSFFEDCKADVVSEIDEREAFERDVLIETIIKERIPEQRRRTAYRKTA